MSETLHPKGRENKTLKRTCRKLIPTFRTILPGVLVLAITVGVGGRMWWHAHNFRDTDNAFINGHVHPVSSRIAGVVTRVFIADNQQVHVGDVIAELDPVDHRIKIEQIRAQIVSNVKQAVQAEAQINQARAQARAAEAQTRQAEAQLARARQDAERYRSLYNDELKVVAKADLDAATTTLAGAEANLTSYRNLAAAAITQIDIAVSARDALSAQKRVLEAQLKDAEQQLSYNRIIAPVSGRIGKRTIEVGARIQPGQQLLALVQDEVWVTANFKETQLRGLYPGQTARVRVDALGGSTLIGSIDSFSPASGAQFALLPPDNATGNFTRIVQRVPVKIVFSPDTIQSLPRALVPGMSATVEVDLRQTGGKGKFAAQQ